MTKTLVERLEWEVAHPDTTGAPYVNDADLLAECLAEIKRLRAAHEPKGNLEPCPTCGKLGTPPPLEEWQLRTEKPAAPHIHRFQPFGPGCDACECGAMMVTTGIFHQLRETTLRSMWPELKPIAIPPACSVGWPHMMVDGKCVSCGLTENRGAPHE